MAKIVNMEEKRSHLAARRGFESWSRRFADSFDEHTTIKDLSEKTLAKLIQPGEESSTSIYELIMGIQGLGPGARFHFLETQQKMAVTDVMLFFLDQLRFEAMRRLGWVGDLPTLDVPIVELIADYTTRFAASRHQTPSLLPTHPRFSEYQETYDSDRASFIRRLIPEVLEIFKEKVE